MTTQEKTEAIRQKCIEANPAIMELGFGCEFISQNGKQKHLIFSVKENHPFVFSAKVKEEHDHYVDFSKENKFEILGRPIRLADVLNALEGVGKKTGLNGVLMTTSGVMFMGKIVEGSCIRDIRFPEMPSWNLKSDDLTAQNSETIDFLFSFLK